MLVSTKGRYALRMMIDLAESYMAGDGKALKVKEVADREGLSVKYLEQLLIILKGAGLVNSIRGPNGGYVLIVPPEKIIIGDLIRVMEGDISINCSTVEGTPCEHNGNCKSMKLWTMVNDAISNVIDNYTLKDIVLWDSPVKEILVEQ